MDESFWSERWREGRIGFHEGRPNAFLARHVARLGARRRVLVPLCGKSEDLAFLAAQGHAVVGVELIEDAVRAFFVEHGLTPEVTAHGAMVAYQAALGTGTVLLLAGDVFATTPALVGAIDALYDRAALIALPPALRTRYVAHARALLPADAPALVITLEYDQARMDGPPFAVLEAELRALYAGREVEWLEEATAGGRIAEMGIDATERCFLVR